jgi:large subunit ribosomal protein L29
MKTKEKAKDFTSLSKDELLTKERDMRQELFNLRLRQQMGGLEKPSRITELRKDIARVQTVLNQQKQGVKKAR